MSTTNIKSALIWATKKLKGTSPSPALDAEVLLSHVFSRSSSSHVGQSGVTERGLLYSHPGQKLTTTQAKKFQGLIMKRAQGWPIAYLTGYKEFFGKNFKVTPAVLIPRPETELLVERTLEILQATPTLNRDSDRNVVTSYPDVKSGLRPKRRNKLRTILDMGTGSGCIAISMSKELPNTHYKVYASDKSLPALKIARHNARLNTAEVKFFRSDLFSKISGKFDVICANLPYVTKNDYQKNYFNLKYEPVVALVDTQELSLFVRFLKKLPYHLYRPGYAILEIEPKDEQRLFRLTKKILPQAEISIRKDYANKNRFLEIRLPDLIS